MSEQIDDGGPAFPVTQVFDEAVQSYVPTVFQGSAQGMSLRDYFAGQALAGLLMTRESRFVEAEHAYQIADAMLAARKVTK